MSFFVISGYLSERAWSRASHDCACIIHIYNEFIWKRNSNRNIKFVKLGFLSLWDYFRSIDHPIPQPMLFKFVTSLWLYFHIFRFSIWAMPDHRYTAPLSLSPPAPSVFYPRRHLFPPFHIWHFLYLIFTIVHIFTGPKYLKLRSCEGIFKPNQTMRSLGKLTNLVDFWTAIMLWTGPICKLMIIHHQTAKPVGISPSIFLKCPT